MRLSEYERLKRFWGRVNFTSGCWEWVGSRIKNSRTGKPGYGCLRVDEGTEYAHRFVWRVYNGEPGKQFVLHRCDNPSCVRLDHLFLGTAKDNVFDMVAKGRNKNNNTGITHCKRGHLFDETNTYFNARGNRTCRACSAAWMRNYRETHERPSRSNPRL